MNRDKSIKMKKVYAEIGFGNDSFLSTEIEEGDEEYRIPEFIIPEKINEFYLRFWVFKKVLIISMLQGVKIKDKNRNKLKILLGVGGIGLRKIKNEKTN